MISGRVPQMISMSCIHFPSQDSDAALPRGTFP
jgi:hypothetical protein